MVRHHDTIQSAHDIIRRILAKHPVALQQESVDEPKYGIVDTVVGRAVDRETDEQIRPHRKQFRKDSEGVAANYTAEKERMEARMIEMEREARRERQRVDAQLASLDRRLQDVTSLSAADRARSEQEAKERDRAEAEHKQQLAGLTRHLRDETDASAAHRARLEQEMKKLGDRVATAVTMPPYPAPYVQVIFCSGIHGG